jgi:hypothetical protein
VLVRRVAPNTNKWNHRIHIYQRLWGVICNIYTVGSSHGIMEDDDDSETIELEQHQDAVLTFLGQCILDTTTVPDEEGGWVAVCFDALAEMYVCVWWCAPPGQESLLL